MNRYTTTKQIIVWNANRDCKSNPMEAQGAYKSYMWMDGLHVDLPSVTCSVMYKASHDTFQLFARVANLDHSNSTKKDAFWHRPLLFESSECIRAIWPYGLLYAANGFSWTRTRVDQVRVLFFIVLFLRHNRHIPRHNRRASMIRILTIVTTPDGKYVEFISRRWQNVPRLGGECDTRHSSHV